eukprot:scaffold283031_cov76-Cyclotella_meneghiniana.AAC.4
MGRGLLIWGSKFASTLVFVSEKLGAWKVLEPPGGQCLQNCYKKMGLKVEGRSQVRLQKETGRSTSHYGRWSYLGQGNKNEIDFSHTD